MLGKLEFDDSLLALLEEAQAIERDGCDRAADELAEIQRALAENDRRARALLDATIDRDTYAKKDAELKDERVTLERRRDRLTDTPGGLSSQVKRLLHQAQGARLHFEDADEALRRELLRAAL